MKKNYDVIFFLIVVFWIKIKNIKKTQLNIYLHRKNKELQKVMNFILGIISDEYHLQYS